MGISGPFLERVAGDAFEAAVTAAIHPDAMPKLLAEHGSDPSAGKKPLGTIRSLNANGVFAATLFDTSYTRALLPALRDGQYGVSYGPTGVIKGRLTRKPPRSEHNPAGIPEFELQSIEELRESSLTVFPADAQTAVRVKDVA